MSWSRRAALVLCLAALAGCGFRPLYATYRDGSVADDMAQIYVAAIADRNGQMLRNHLLDMMTPKGVPDPGRYRLEVNLNSSRPPTVLSTDELASRRDFRLNANFVLMSADGKTVLKRGRHQAITSYNIVDSEFASLSSLRRAEELAVGQVAEAIRTQLALYFADRR